VAEGLRRVGSDLTREKLADALETLDNHRISEIASPRTFTTWHHIGNFQTHIVVVLGQHSPGVDADASQRNPERPEKA
jgi:branched-chain amino acid transport system substrate-binding protein